MAEAIAVAETVFTLIKYAQKTVTYIQEAKGADDERTKLRNEINVTVQVLSKLQIKANDDEWKATMELLNVPQGPFDQFKTVLEQLESKLKPAEGKTAKLRTAIIWPLQKAKIQEVLTTIEHSKSLFTLALQNEHMYILLRRR
jgi:hypothetical protein